MNMCLFRAQNSSVYGCSSLEPSFNVAKHSPLIHVHSSVFIRMNLCMAQNAHISSSNSLTLSTIYYNICPPTISSCPRTGLRIGRGCGHQPLEVILSHQNESVYGSRRNESILSHTQIHSDETG